MKNGQFGVGKECTCSYERVQRGLIFFREQICKGDLFGGVIYSQGFLLAFYWSGIQVLLLYKKVSINYLYILYTY